MPEDDERELEQRDDDRDAADAGSEPGPQQVLEETSDAIGRAGDEATSASEELKKDVRAQVDDAREAT